MRIIIILLTIITFSKCVSAQNPYYNVEFTQPEIEGYTSVLLHNDTLFCYGVYLDGSNDQKIRLDIRELDSSLISTRFYGGFGYDLVGFLGYQPLIINDKIYFTGSDNIDGYHTPNLFSTNLNGDELSATRIDFNQYTYYHSSVNDGFDNIVLAGFTRDTLGGDDNVFVTKIDTLGNIIWSYEYGDINTDAGYTIHRLSDFGFVIGGFTKPGINLRTHQFLLKIDSIGNEVWKIDDGNFGSEVGFSQLLNSGNSMFYGSYNEFTESDSGKVRIREVDNLGNVILDSTYDLAKKEYENMRDMVEVDDGYVFIGIQAFASSLIESFIYKTDFDGRMIWYRKYNRRNNGDSFYDIELHADGSFYIVGILDPPTILYTQDAWLLHLNCLGYDTLPRANFELPGLSSSNYYGVNMSFVNTSRYAEAYHWDFGDGESYFHYSDPAIEESDQPVVSHTYTVPGTYTVTLMAIACNDTTIKAKEITVRPEQIVDGGQLSVYPNPSSTEINIWHEELEPETRYDLDIFSADGKQVVKKHLKGQEFAHGYKLPTFNWADGTYSGYIRKDKEIWDFRFVKVE